MRIVVDTNIVFSAILNSNSKIARIIMQPKTNFIFYSTEQLLFELQEHKKKIHSIAQYSDFELERIISLITKRIRFINVRLIPKSIYNKAEILATDIDKDDCEFVALTEHIKGKMWSGDKELKKGLTKKRWNKFITTEDLFDILTKQK